MLYTTLLLILSCTFELCFSFPGKILGPGILIFQSFERCDPPINDIDLWISQRKYNRTTNVLDMDLTTPWPLSDDINIEVKTATKKDGGYKPGSFYLKGPFCSTLKTLVGDLYYAILEATGVEECPMPGTVKVTDFFVDSEQLNDQILYGEYRAELNFFLEDQIKGCYLLYLNLVPKE